ncbi:hypothetical protein Ct61P_02183 [Colletotrichum tofieldiae]|nr:hypothetical protein Ct61P_02183 [Colletotrichum tofieldiae]
MAFDAGLLGAPQTTTAGPPRHRSTEVRWLQYVATCCSKLSPLWSLTESCHLRPDLLLLLDLLPSIANIHVAIKLLIELNTAIFRIARVFTLVLFISLVILVSLVIEILRSTRIPIPKP